jgi:lambda family phage portal protein
MNKLPIHVRIRHAFRMMAGGYDGAIASRFRNDWAWNRSIPGTEENVLGVTDRDKLRLECRDLFRNNEIARGAVDRFVDYAIWHGLYPQFRTSDPKWNKRAGDWWRQIYVPTADHRQIRSVNLITLQKLQVSHRILDGECGFILLQNGQLQAIEADRIATPSKESRNPLVTEGIARTKGGIVRGYFICERKNGGAVDHTKCKFVRRENFVHSYHTDRIDQVRGVPDLAPCINKLRDYDETDENVLGKIKADAKTWAIDKHTSGMPNEGRRNSYNKTDSDGKDKTRVEKLEDLRIIHRKSGDSLDPFASKTPNSEYVPYLKHELQAIAAALNISYEILMLIYTEGSFSSQRAALIHNTHTFRSWTQWCIDTAWNRICNWRIAKAMKDGTLPPAPIDPTTGLSEWHKKTWTIPYLDWLDPLKQRGADKRAYDMGLTNLAQLNSSIGQSRDEVLHGKDEDFRFAIELAKKTKDETGQDVTWRDYIGVQPTATVGGAA